MTFKCMIDIYSMVISSYTHIIQTPEGDEREREDGTRSN